MYLQIEKGESVEKKKIQWNEPKLKKQLKVRNVHYIYAVWG